MTPIWQRTLYKEVLKMGALILFSLFFFYTVLDYSAHMQDFICDKTLQPPQIAIYYLHQFSKRIELLLPLALLIATIKVLTTMNARRELLALFVAGLRPATLCRPILHLAGLCSLLLYANSEYVLPSSIRFLDQFYRDHFRHSQLGKRRDPFYVTALPDGSKLIYQTEEKDAQQLVDVLWVRSVDDIWRMRALKTDCTPLEGRFVDHLQRDAEQLLQISASYPSLPLKDLPWRHDLPVNCAPSWEDHTLSELAALWTQPEALAHLAHKSALPLLCPLVVLATTPFCLRFRRNTNPFAIYAVAIFGLLALYMLLDAALILGETRALPPLRATLIPLALAFSAFGWRFVRVA